MNTPSGNHVLRSGTPLTICYNVTENILQFGSSSSAWTEQLYKLGIHRTIPVWSLDKHLPGNSILDQVQVYLLFDNTEVCKATQAYEDADVSRHDFLFKIHCGAGQRLTDILAHMSAKVNLITAEGRLAYEGQMGLDVFSAEEICRGAIKQVIMPFRCTVVNTGNICPVDVLLSVIPSPMCSRETGAVRQVFENALETGVPTHHAVQQLAGPSKKTRYAKTEVESTHLRGMSNKACLPIDVPKSQPKDITPNPGSHPLTSIDMAVQGGRSIPGCRKGSRSALTESGTCSGSQHQNEIKDLQSVAQIVLKSLKRRRQAARMRSSQFRGSPFPSLSEIQLQIKELDKSIAQLETTQRRNP